MHTQNTQNTQNPACSDNPEKMPAPVPISNDTSAIKGENNIKQAVGVDPPIAKAG